MPEDSGVCPPVPDDCCRVGPPSVPTAHHEHPATVEAKLAVVAETVRYEFPAADIDVMLCEIESDCGLS